MANESEKQKESPKKGGKVAIIVGVVVIIALLGVIVFLLLKEQKLEERVESSTPEIPKRDVVVTQDNVDEVVDDMVNQEYVEPGYYEASMSVEWHFATGSVASEDAFVENKAANTNDVYFDVFLADDESTPILQSPVIPRGSKMENIKLDKPLEKGTYDCVIVYHLVDDEQNTISTLRVGFKIIVEE